MKISNFYFLLLMPASVLLYEQTQYKVDFERIETVRYDKRYMVLVKTHNFKYNRTQAFVNATYHYKVDFGNDMDIEVQAYTFLSNEYRSFPLRFMFNFCASAAKNDFGIAGQFRCGNFSCPLKKGLNYMCNWAPDARKFPPLVPKGRYMIDMKCYYRGVEAYFLQGYGTVKYPEI